MRLIIHYYSFINKTQGLKRLEPKGNGSGTHLDQRKLG